MATVWRNRYITHSIDNNLFIKYWDWAVYDAFSVLFFFTSICLHLHIYIYLCVVVGMSIVRLVFVVIINDLPSSPNRWQMHKILWCRIDAGHIDCWHFFLSSDDQTKRYWRPFWSSENVCLSAQWARSIAYGDNRENIWHYKSDKNGHPRRFIHMTTFYALFSGIRWCRVLYNFALWFCRCPQQYLLDNFLLYFFFVFLSYRGRNILYYYLLWT